jgi:CBS-domain-containing membrane protein
MALRSSTAADLMTRELLAFDKRMSISKAAALLRFHELEAAPVVDNQGRLAGVVTLANCSAWEDFSRRSAAYGSAHQHPDLTPVWEISSPAVASVHQDAPANEVVDHFVTQRARRVYVFNDDHEVVGVVSMADVIRHFINDADDSADFLIGAAAC